jgi:hypothetical protein
MVRIHPPPPVFRGIVPLSLFGPGDRSRALSGNPELPHHGNFFAHFSTAWKKLSTPWKIFSTPWKFRIFCHKGRRAAEPQPNPSIRLTQEAQGAQKERKRRSGQPFSRQGRGERKGAFVGGGAGIGAQKNGGERGIRTLGTDYYQYDGLANRCFRPLSHLSAGLGEHRGCGGRGQASFLPESVFVMANSRGSGKFGATG